MDLVVYIVLNIFILIIIFTTIYYIISSRSVKTKITNFVTSSKYYSNISNNIFELQKRDILKTSYITNDKILIISIVCFIFIFILIFYLFNSVGMSLIFALLVALIPNMLLGYAIKKEKSKIIYSTVTFLINLRNHISKNNNIVLAIRKTNVEGPLDKYIKNFLSRIDMGMNIYEALVILKQELDINIWNDVISSLQACYKNGGDFNVVLTAQINSISKSLAMKEKEKEEAYGSVITLVVMMIMSMFLLVKYACVDNNSASIITTTVAGKMILTYTAISYVISLYFISKIYKVEG